MRYIKSKDMKKEINYSAEFVEMANRGEQMYYMNALFWLSDAFMRLYDNPKFGTVIYRASEGWNLKLRKSSHPLAFNAMCNPVMLIFQYANPKYTSNYNSNPFYLLNLSNEEIYQISEEMLKNEIKEDKELCEALCAGLRMIIKSNLPMDSYQISDICFNTDDYTFYNGYIFKTSSLTDIKLHVFELEGIMSDFHFVIDFLKYLSTDELHLVYQNDAKKNLKLKGKLCSWDGYEMIAECLRERFESKRYPLEKMTLFYIKEIDMKLYRWGKKTIKELMAIRGLTPHEKYANYIERSHHLTLKRAS